MILAITLSPNQICLLIASALLICFVLWSYYVIKKIEMTQHKATFEWCAASRELREYASSEKIQDDHANYKIPDSPEKLLSPDQIVTDKEYLKLLRHERETLVRYLETHPSCCTPYQKGVLISILLEIKDDKKLSDRVMNLVFN